MLAFRSLDPFRALREPDRRRRDEERLSRSEQRTLSKTKTTPLTGKAPYRFESRPLDRRVGCEPDPEPFRHTSRKGPGDHPRVRIKIIANSEAIALRLELRSSGAVQAI